MGVVIRSYRQLTPRDAYLVDGADPHDPSTKAYIGDDCIVAFVNPQHPMQADRIPHGSVWNYTEQMHVISTTYNHYNELRQELAQMAGHVSGQLGPFHELIDFSDCEGVIGWQTSAKLALDFANYQQLASRQDPMFYFIYCNFLRGFQVASDNGLMKFC